MQIARPILLATALLAAGLVTTDGFAADSKIAALRVYPAEVKLTTARDYQSFVVQAVQADGITRDVTSAAKFTLANTGLVTLNGATLKPKADGKTTLSVEYGGKKIVVPMTSFWNLLYVNWTGINCHRIWCVSKLPKPRLSPT